MNAEELNRKRLIERIEKMTDYRLTAIQNKFFRYVIDHFEHTLDFSNGKLKMTNKNLFKINDFSLVEETFFKKETKPFVNWMAKQFVRIMSVNATYFNKHVTPVGKIKDKVETGLLAQLGVKKKDGKTILDRRGFLSKIADPQNAYIRVREIALNSVKNGVPLEQMKTEIQQFIKPSDRLGGIKRHFYTTANDIYSQFDRQVQKDYADKLGLNAFIYSGGLIRSSRDFCEERNGQVFTRDEAEQWRDLQWQGKPATNYEPLRDMGGHNCRHFTSWIDDKQAIRERPELAEILGT